MRHPRTIDARRILVGLSVLAVGLTGAAARAGAPLRMGRLPAVEAAIDGVSGEVLRVEMPVPENPSRDSGRQVTLAALVLRATESKRPAEPMFVFQGGPGQGATDLAAFYARFFAPLRARHDIVLMDQRGTGGSHPLTPSVAPEHLLDDLGAVAPASWVAPMREGLRDTVDLAQYTTRRIVDDAARLIEALGYSRVNLYGTSYGTRCAQVFMRRYPGRVRAAVLKNVLPMSAVIPLSYAANAQRALDLMLADVAADSAARASYPGLGRTLTGLLDRLAATPARVTVKNPATGRAQEIELTRRGVAMTIRTMLMSPQSRAAIPYLIDRAASGSFDELAAQMVQVRVAYARTLALGMAISVLASEDTPRITAAGIARDTTGSFLGDAAAADLRDACASWPHRVERPGFFEPVHVKTPTLLISGWLDPATPPAWGDEVARGLPNSAHAVFRYAAHPNAGFLGLEDLVAAFV